MKITFSHKMWRTNVNLKSLASRSMMVTKGQRSWHRHTFSTFHIASYDASSYVIICQSMKMTFNTESILSTGILIQREILFPFLTGNVKVVGSLLTYRMVESGQCLSVPENLEYLAIMWLYILSWVNQHQSYVDYIVSDIHNHVCYHENVHHCWRRYDRLHHACQLSFHSVPSGMMKPLYFDTHF